MDKEVRIQRLLRRASAYSGMIDEARIRGNLLMQKVQKAKADGIAPENLREEVDRTCKQLTRQTDKYLGKMQDIYEELKSYGLFSELE